MADFAGNNVPQPEAAEMADCLRTELVNTGLFNVMDKVNMDAVLAEARFQNPGCTEQECAVAMGKLLKVKQMLVGSLSKLLDDYFITVTVVDAETGKITASYGSDTVPADKLKEACKKLAEQLSGK